MFRLAGSRLSVFLPFRASQRRQVSVIVWLRPAKHGLDAGGDRAEFELAEWPRPAGVRGLGRRATMSETVEQAVPPFCDWLDRILARGESVQDAPPALPAPDWPAAESLLRAAFDVHALDVAGPPLPFDPGTAIEAALVLARACWSLVGAEEGPPATLTLDVVAAPAAQLSADVTLRFFPAVYRRARLREPDGPLVRQIHQLLRLWPLSGVLADLDGVPLTPPEFGGHPGLQLLYAERLALTNRPGWVPTDGPARAWVERVYLGLGKPLPAVPPEESRV